MNLKNCDNKSMAAIVNNKLKKTLAKWAHKDQRGFVATRQGLANVVEIDTAARLVDFQVGPGELPAITLFDFAAAFPSLAHAFLMIALKAAILNPSALAFVSALYENNEVYSCVGGVVSFLFFVLCGVLQGCPLSGSLFVIAINTCLLLPSEALPPGGGGSQGLR